VKDRCLAEASKALKAFSGTGARAIDPYISS
jgi:hypothetical protein